MFIKGQFVAVWKCCTVTELLHQHTQSPICRAAARRRIAASTSILVPLPRMIDSQPNSAAAAPDTIDDQNLKTLVCQALEPYAALLKEQSNAHDEKGRIVARPTNTFKSKSTSRMMASPFEVRTVPRTNSSDRETMGTLPRTLTGDTHECSQLSGDEGPFDSPMVFSTSTKDVRKQKKLRPKMRRQGVKTFNGSPLNVSARHFHHDSVEENHSSIHRNFPKSPSTSTLRMVATFNRTNSSQFDRTRSGNSLVRRTTSSESNHSNGFETSADKHAHPHRNWITRKPSNASAISSKSSTISAHGRNQWGTSRSPARSESPLSRATPTASPT